MRAGRIERLPEASALSVNAAVARLRSYPPGVKLVLAVYALAFAFGTCVHLSLLLGFSQTHTHAVSQSLIYGYDTLAFLDPLTIFLLVRFPRAGLLLAVAIMLADVGVNALYSHFHPPTGAHVADYGALANGVFLGFVLVSAPCLWPHLARA